MLDTARGSLTELGLHHGLLEVDLFAGIVELVANDPAAAESYLRHAYAGFRRMGVRPTPPKPPRSLPCAGPRPR